VGEGRIYEILDKHQVPRRHQVDTAPLCTSKAELEELYINQGLTEEQIGCKLGAKRDKVHYLMKKYQIPARKRPGWHIDGYGYVKVVCKGHPRADHSGGVYEHILVMEKKLGRFILPWERIHHFDGNRANNNEANLQLMSAANHTLVTLMCANCPLRKRVRLLEFQVKRLNKALQYKLAEV